MISSSAAQILPAAPTANPSAVFSGASAGSVVATAFVNYNASIAGNFPSAVWAWDGGSAAVDPLTDHLWIPEWPIPVLGLPAPNFAPALNYNPADNQTQMVKSLSNTSAIAFDPLTGNFYATDPVTNTVLVFSPTSDALVHPPIPVGINPTSILYDSYSHNIYVANAVSNNVTVINGTTSAIQIAGIGAGTGPVALADDVKDQFLYVADSGGDTVSRISTRTNVAGTQIPLSTPATSLGYSASLDLLAVGRPTSALLTIYNAATESFSSAPNVGHNVASIVPNLSGMLFAVANGTGSQLTVVNATTGAILSAHPSAGTDPARLTLDPDNGLVYVWSGATRTITTINLTTLSEEQTSPDLGVRANTMAYDADTGDVFVTDWLSDSVEVLNASTFQTASVPISLPGAPQSLAYDSTTGIVYAGFTGGVAAIDGATGSLIRENTALAGNNTQLVLDSASSLLWEMNKVSGLESLNLPALTVDEVPGIGAGTTNVRGIVLDPTTNDLFVINPLNATIAVVNGATGAEVGPAISSVPGPVSLAYDPADQEVYVLGHGVWIVNPTTHAIVAGPISIAPHASEWSIVYDPSREFLYVTSNSSTGPPWPGNLTVIDGSSVAASEGTFATIPVGQLPLDILPVNLPGSSALGSGEIWVTNYLSGTVSIIASPPQVTYLAATPNPVDVGSRSSILLGFTGGAGPSQVSYTGLPSGCSSANTLTLNCTTDSEGTYSITANIVDSLGFNTSATTVLSVSPAIQVQVNVGSGTTSTEVDLGDSVNASAVVTGGTAPYNYTWNFGDGTVGWGASVSHTFTAAGDYLVTVTVTDSGSGVGASTSTVTVEPLPTVSVSATPSNVTDVNVPIAFLATISGGTAPAIGSWNFGDGTSANGTSVSHSYSTDGVYFAVFHFVDASGANGSGFITVQVNPVLSASASVPTQATAGSAVSLNATISGGTPTYTVLWAFDDSSYAFGLSAEHTYATAGTYTVTLSVTDGVGAHSNTTYRIVVASGSTVSSTSGGTFDSGLLLGLLVGAALAAVILFAVTRSKSRPPPPATAYVPPAGVTTSGDTGDLPPWKED
jgi:YVTN family beta-propeller protein